jgi:DNA invertase Pin-like site-specific DNA recombinase
MFFSILAAFAEFEHASMKARTLDGLAVARARGRNGGRKPALTARQVAKIRADVDAGASINELTIEMETVH